MKKIVALLLSLVMVLSLVACGGNDTTKSDLEKVKDAGKLVVGITEFEPMDYKDKDGNWVGFDADMATAFAEYLGVEVDFEVIVDWTNKHLELNNGSYDCVWNAMTLTDEVTAEMACKAYCNNHQVVVVKADKADQYTTEESVENLVFAVERGSAGEAEAKARGWETNGVDDQASALTEVKAGASDAAIVDYLMAVAMVGPNTDFSNLVATSIYVSDEELGVGFRKDSDLLPELEKFFEKAYADGTMMKCAKKYGLEDDIIEQK
ncbi:MAG: transporter substrate-binding domain-containing protein [Faecalimonas sp.]|nr:transporter substrate-binding domain-containing protein [Faecalimonas sp.]